MVESTGDEFVLHELWTLTAKLSRCNLEGDHKEMLEEMIIGLELCSRKKTKATQRHDKNEKKAKTITEQNF